MDLKKIIRNVNDFPKKGIIFRDITTLLKQPQALNYTADKLYDFAKQKNITKVVGIESRGFIFGAILAQKLNAGFVPVRKAGKLPADKISESYQLEYGIDVLEIHYDSIEPADKVLVHDDLIATGGTIEAVCKMIEKLGAEVSQISCVIELSFLKGREKLSKYDLYSIVVYENEN